MHIATKAYNSYKHTSHIHPPKNSLLSSYSTHISPLSYYNIVRFNTEFSKAFKLAITAATSTPSPTLTGFHMKKLHCVLPYAEEHNIVMNPRSDLKMPK